MTEDSLPFQGPLVLTSAHNWRAIYDELLPRVFHYFAYRVSDIQLAEDLTATTFEKAWRHRKQFTKERGEVEQWLFGIARRVAIDHYRSQPAPISLEEAVSTPSEISVERAVERRDEYKRLAGLLQTQSEQVREIISLKYGAGLTNRRIAGILGLSESNVGTIMHRAVEDLRERWEDQDG